ncbi:uncharacterized protein LOC135927301 isoform X1 [Gordionus sp. m RMFG-2023]|uniref:uncharacterized protein LOC135927301 isoform X1 n=1 Tax=Gordionus sp. m RMFG-2023 TaxID=3053472 RepID=UPI0031FE1627
MGVVHCSDFSQANQNMTETINLPASNTENTQLYAIKLSSSQIISKNMLGAQVKIPETTNLYSQYHFQNIPKNLGPQSKTIPASIFCVLIFIIYKIKIAFEFSLSQNISKNILGTQIKLPNTTKTLDYTGYSLQNLSKFF